MENLMFEEMTEEEAFNVDGGGWLSWVGGAFAIAGVVAAGLTVTALTGGLVAGTLAVLGGVYGGTTSFFVGLSMLSIDQ